MKCASEGCSCTDDVVRFRLWGGVLQLCDSCWASLLNVAVAALSDTEEIV